MPGERTTGPDDSLARTARRLAEGVRDQQDRLSRLAGAAGGGGVRAVVAEIDVAHEELRVAENELRAHQARVDELLSARLDPDAWRRRLFDTLPVPAVLTDGAGVVREVNGPARLLLGRRRDDVVERELADLVAEADRARVEGVVVDLTRSPGPGRVRAAVLTAAGPVDVDLVAAGVADGEVAPPAGPAPAVTWVLHRRGEPSDVRLAEALALMTRLPAEVGADARRVLAGAALLVERAMPHCDGVSITLGPPDAPEAQATDNVLAQAVDAAQLEAGEGPCLTAYATGRVQETPDVRHDPRWPVLAERVGRTGVASVIGAPLRTERAGLGVLNLYARRPGAFDQRDRDVADLLVTAVLAVVQEARERHELVELSDQLREAMATRAVIDQAKGILMARGGYDADQAFAQLVAASRRTNVKVRDIARLLVDDVSGGQPPV